MSKRKLLLADDSVTIQKVVNLTFADEGIEVITTGDGNSAMEKLRETSPDLVMADVNMPGLNGYQVCEQIKADEATRKTPVILLVGSFEPFDEAMANAVGADDYLTKPFQSIRQLVNKVNELLAVQSTKPVELSADTLEMERPELPEKSEFEDTGMDDDMIETNQGNKFSSFDMSPVSGKTNFSDNSETPETDTAAETDFEPTGERDAYKVVEEEIVRTEKRYFDSFESSYSEVVEETANHAEEDVLPEPADNMTDSDEDYFSSETAPLAGQQEQNFEKPEQKMDNFHEENKEQTADETSEPVSSTIQDRMSSPMFAETADEIPQPVSASVLELDEFNLLDLPPFGVEEADEEADETEFQMPAAQPPIEEPTAPETVQTVEESEVKTEVARQFSALDFPPEVIEAIADKVVEKLSQKLKE